MTASISPPVAETARFFLVFLAVISFTADVADGQECASPFGNHSGTDLKYCVLKAGQAVDTDPDGADPCAATDTSGSVTDAGNRCTNVQDSKCEFHSVVEGGILPWSSWMEFHHVEFVNVSADLIKIAEGSHAIQCKVRIHNDAWSDTRLRHHAVLTCGISCRLDMHKVVMEPTRTCVQQQQKQRVS